MSGGGDGFGPNSSDYFNACMREENATLSARVRELEGEIARLKPPIADKEVAGWVERLRNHSGTVIAGAARDQLADLLTRLEHDRAALPTQGPR